jgi:hypothetical protein
VSRLVDFQVMLADPPHDFEGQQHWFFRGGARDARELFWGFASAARQARLMEQWTGSHETGATEHR